jgi:hypothetical protein
LANRLSSPGVLPVPPTPLLVLAPNERRGDDENFSKQTTHLLLLRSREPEKRSGCNSPGPRRIGRDPGNESLLTGRIECGLSDPLGGSSHQRFILHLTGCLESFAFPKYLRTTRASALLVCIICYTRYRNEPNKRTVQRIALGLKLLPHQSSCCSCHHS